MSDRLIEVANFELTEARLNSTPVTSSKTNTLRPPPGFALKTIEEESASTDNHSVSSNEPWQYTNAALATKVADLEKQIAALTSILTLNNSNLSKLSCPETPVMTSNLLDFPNFSDNVEVPENEKVPPVPPLPKRQTSDLKDLESKLAFSFDNAKDSTDSLLNTSMICIDGTLPSPLLPISETSETSTKNFFDFSAYAGAHPVINFTSQSSENFKFLPGNSSSVTEKNSRLHVAEKTAKTRETFEKSMTQSVETFFKRIKDKNENFRMMRNTEIKTELKETNPFKRNPFQEEKIPPPLPARDNLKKQDSPSTCSTKVVYQASPVMYSEKTAKVDLSNESISEKATLVENFVDFATAKSRNVESSRVSVNSEDFVASKQRNVESWIAQGQSSNEENRRKNLATEQEISKINGNHASTNGAKTKIKTPPPPLPPRPKANDTFVFERCEVEPRGKKSFGTITLKESIAEVKRVRQVIERSIAASPEISGPSRALDRAANAEDTENKAEASQKMLREPAFTPVCKCF